MELMATCLEKLLKAYKAPFPEHILGKVSFAVGLKHSENSYFLSLWNQSFLNDVFRL